jgi:hypothetical protein
MSTIESTVTRLLVATKQLLESLTQWARGEASEQDVSDVYVNLGNEFNVACRAFLNAGVDVTDLGDVPQALRVILEKALSEDASQENLDRYLPSIREIIVNLLRQLKQKQGTIRAQHGRAAPPRASTIPNPKYTSRTDLSAPGTAIPQAPRQSSYNQLPNANPNAQSPTATSTEPTHQSRPYESRQEVGLAPNGSELTNTSIPLPKSPVSPRKDNALLALQKGEALERRASRRFSAYQFAKLTNGAHSSKESLVPDLPPLPAAVRSSVLPTKASHESSPPEIVSSTSMVDEKIFSPKPATLPGSPLPVSATTTADNTDISGETEIPAYLQIGRKVKRTIIKRVDLTLPALRLLFIDKFAYNPGAENFPDIYIQDPQSGVRYELDESAFNEVHSGSLLSLNIEAMDEIKKHITDSMEKLTQHVTTLNQKMDQHSTSIQKLQESQRAGSGSATSNSMMTGSGLPSPVRSVSVSSDRPISSVNLKNVDDLRRDIAVVRQVSNASFEGLKSQLQGLLEKAKSLNLSSNLSVPGSTTRIFMEACHKKLSVESDSLLTSVDDLQEII